MDGKKKRYSADELKKAAEEVRKGRSFRDAARAFGIPKSTIRDVVTNRYSRNRGAPAVFTTSEETEIVKWILARAAAGLPVGEKQVISYVTSFAKFYKKESGFKDGTPTRGWLRRFLARHPELSKRTANNLAKKRVITEANIRQWFDDILKYLETNGYVDVLSDPTRIFNMDETAFFLVPRRQKVIASKDSKTVQALTSNNDKENYTVLISASAAGVLAPPLVLFPYKSRIPGKIACSVPKGWSVGRSDSGWMNSNTFFEFIANVFYPWTVESNIKFPIILFVDGHSSHATYETVEFCKSKQIVLVSLFPNATHVMQPLDVAFFAPMKTAWQAELKKWRFDHDGAMITRCEFAPLLEITLQNMASKESSLINGFRKCGLYPFDADAIDYLSFPNPAAKPSSTLESYLPLPPLQEEEQMPFGMPAAPQQEINSTMLHFLNTKLLPCQLATFREHRNKFIWPGPVEDTNLFYLWRNTVDEVEGPPEYMIIDSPFVTIDEDLQAFDDTQVTLRNSSGKM
ncbi:tigger transposable element-derived protein 2-like [Armigeres subalbatus]|uniref:tigger transposable element-derived protein 2-like n=1 Tax=Armigeres subalbatus TaxID=124917 RepID=UPI002ED3B27C